MVPYEKLRYNQVRQKSSHNSFGEDEGLYDQMIYWRVRSIELDINAIGQGGTSDAERPVADPGTWLVYHDTPLPTPPSSVRTLSQALKILAGMNRALPSHEVITVFLDTSGTSLNKPGHDPAGLDEALATLDGFLLADSTLAPGASAIFKPSDLLASKPGATHLQDAVRGNWPRLADLRNKFIFVITGDGVAHYYTSDPDRLRTQVAFVAPEIGMDLGRKQVAFSSALHAAVVGPPTPVIADIDNLPAREQAIRDEIGRLPNAIFLNVKYSEDNLSIGLAAFRDARGDVENGLVTRLFPTTLSPIHDDLNTRSDWDVARGAHFHHIATNEINAIADPFTATNSPGGWPFEVIENITDRPSEPDEIHGDDVIRKDVIGLKVHSADMAKSDSCLFYHADVSGMPDLSIAAVVSSPNSRVKPWAKGHLMARASLAPGADYIAVCRPARANPIQVQIRQGGTYQERQYKPGAVKSGDLRQDTPVFVRLVLSADGKSAQGFASVTGAKREWEPIGDAVAFASPLVVAGIAASSNGGDPIVFQFKIMAVEPPVSPERLNLVRIGDHVTEDRVYRNEFAAAMLK